MSLRDVIPPLRIHVWGGYGSQLYAIYLALRIQQKYPWRRILIVAHTSGVTERRLEISKYRQFESSQVNDFNSPHTNFQNKEPTSGSKVKNHRAIFKSILVWSGLLSHCNTEKDFNELKPWVLSCRGHYTHMLFNPEIISLLYKVIVDEASPRKIAYRTIGVQYRLGDLIQLQNKSPIDSKDIVRKIREVREFANLGITLCSDTPDLALMNISHNLGDTLSVSLADLKPDDVIVEFSNIFAFIGTTSKLSVWIAVFRSVVNGLENTFLPDQFEFEMNLHGINAGIEFY